MTLSSKTRNQHPPSAIMYELDRLRAENAMLRDLLRECSDDLESEVEGHYAGVKDHPAMTPKYDRDMEMVRRARLYLGSKVK